MLRTFVGGGHPAQADVQRLLPHLPKLLTAGGIEPFERVEIYSLTSKALRLRPIFVFALVKRALRWGHVRYSHQFVVMSLLATAVYYLAFARGIALLPSSEAIPLFTFICAWLFLREEHINRTKAGVAVGFLGMLLIARPWSGSGAIDLVGVTCMVVGSMSVGCSFVYAREFISPLKLPAVALTPTRSASP